MEPVVWSVLLLAVGLGLVILDLFVPSGGILSFFGALCVASAVFVGFTASVKFGVILFAVTLILIPAILAAAVKYWPHTPIGKLVLLGRPEDPDDVLPESEEYRGLKRLVGRRGRSTTRMLPSGIVKLGGRSYDAVSEGMAIEPGQTVQVVDVRTNRLIVRPAPPAPNNGDEPDEDLLSQPIDTLGIDGLEDPLR